MNLFARAKFLMLSMVLFPVLAFAQDAGVALGLAPSPTPLVLDPTDLGAVAKLILDAVMNKQWGIVVSLSITAIIAGLRKWIPETTKVGAWFRTKLGAIIMNFALSLGMGFLTLFMAGGSFSLDLVLKALSVALGASGGWAIWKNVTEAIAEKKAQDVGAAAETTPTDTLNK